jgi:polysaccharide biosynthesis protein PslG
MARHPRSLELTRRLLPAAAAIAALLGCSPAARGSARQGSAARSDSVSAGVGTAKRVSFAVLEDYDKGEDLAEVARDFELMRDLGVRTWRGSFGWDDYEPAPGRYDFAWLHRFADLAER